MPITLDASLFPLFVATATGVLTDAEYKSHLQECTVRIIDCGEPYAFVYDGTEIVKMAPSTRKLQADWINRHRHAIARRNRGCGFVFDSATLRGLLTAVHWLSPPPYPYAIFSQRTGAMRWCLEKLAEAGERCDRGRTVGRYEILGSLGRGGSATVYEAVDRAFHRRVALKILDGGPVDPSNAGLAATRFLREARAASRVRHAHVVEVIDFGQADGVRFIAMELVEGETLAQTLRRERKLPLGRAVEILLPILSAVAALHSVGIVHRDIKPSNILLAGTRGACPKLSDFGVARLNGSPSITCSRDILGTPAYLPPELIAGSATEASERSDQYSLGVTLYECTTGQRPFAGESSDDVMRAVISAALPPPSSREPRLPKAFDDVVLRATRRDPGARFASVTDLARALLPFASASVAARWQREFGAGGRPVGAGAPGRISGHSA